MDPSRTPVFVLREQTTSTNFNDGVREIPRIDEERASGFRLRLAQANHFVTRLVLTAFLKQLDTLKALENIAFGGDGAGAFQASMLGHKN